MNKTKRAIFETSMKLFAEKGYEATSVEEITATVGVAKGTLYYHFSSKEEIFNFLVEQGMNLLKNSIFIKTSKLDNSIDKIKAIILIEIKIMLKYENFIILLLSEIWGSSSKNIKCRKEVFSCIQILEDIINEGIKKGEIKQINVKVASTNIFTMICSGLIYKKQQNDKIVIQELYNESVKMIIEGLLMSKKNGQFEYREYIDDQKMHKLYEKFILEYYRYHYSNLNPSVPQVEWNLDEENEYLYLLPKMQTDITLYNKNRTLIIDAKYYNNMYQNNTMFDKETFRSNNLYQIYTYVKNEDKKNTGNVSGMLMYIKTDENEKQFVEYKMGNNKIIVCNLDLSNNFSNVEKQLNDIADKFIANTL